jgi:hypothetical protein
VVTPPLYDFGPTQQAACHYPLERWPMNDDEIRRPTGPPMSPPPAPDATP